MANIGTLAISVVAKTEKFEKGMKKAKGSWTSFVKGFVSIAAIAGAVRGITSVASELSRRIDEASQRVDRLAKAGRAIGVTYQEMRRLEIIAKMSGIEVKNLSTGMRTLATQVYNARAGLAESVRMFDSLGMSVSELQGLSMPAMMERVAKAIQKVPDPAERLALAARLLGEEGGKIAAAADGLADAAAAAERINDALTEIDVRNIEAANDAMTELSETSNSFFNKMAAQSAPMRRAIIELTSEHLQLGLSNPYGTLFSDLAKYSNLSYQAIGATQLLRSVSSKMAENQTKDNEKWLQSWDDRIKADEDRRMQWQMEAFGIGPNRWAEQSGTDYATAFEDALSKKLNELPQVMNRRQAWLDSFVGGMRQNVAGAINDEMSAIERAMATLNERADAIRSSSRERMSAGVQAKTSGFDIRGLMIGGGLNNQEQKQLDELEDQSKYLQLIYRRLGNQVAMVGA